MAAVDDGAPDIATQDDDDLDEFVRGQRRSDRIHPVRVVLAVASLLAAAWVLVPTVDELAYHFNRQTAPLDIGDARADVLAKVKDGTWVRANVVLGNKAAEIPTWRKGSLRFGPITVREAVGAPVVLEFDANARRDLLPFSDVNVDGRLVSFGPDGELADVRRWFEAKLDLRPAVTARAIVVDERPGQLIRYVITWVVSLTIVVFSFGGIIRRLRPR